MLQLQPSFSTRSTFIYPGVGFIQVLPSIQESRYERRRVQEGGSRCYRREYGIAHEILRKAQILTSPKSLHTIKM